MSVETTKKQVSDFIFPTVKEQRDKYFGKRWYCRIGRSIAWTDVQG